MSYSKNKWYRFALGLPAHKQVLPPIDKPVLVRCVETNNGVGPIVVGCRINKAQPMEAKGRDQVLPFFTLAGYIHGMPLLWCDCLPDGFELPDISTACPMISNCRSYGRLTMRNMSFSATTEEVRNKSKTVTRRMGWKFLKVGDLVQPVVKGQGLAKGEKVEKIGGPIRILSVRREPLYDIADSYHDVYLEGFTRSSPADFIRTFIEINNCRFDSIVTRIEFEYTD
jgi:hypothetical protein